MQVEQKPKQQVTVEVVLQPDTTAKLSKRHWRTAILAFVIVVGTLLSALLPRVKAKTVLQAETEAMSAPNVSIVQPRRSAPEQEIVLPANVRPFINAPIYSRTNGYLKQWYVDIGARVKKGQLLAEIETPEVDQQLGQARANLATAQANLNLSRITAARYQDLLKTNSVAQQDADNATGAYQANQATVQSNAANVRQLEELQSFEKIYAPFDGVITARNTDIGALINSGSSGGPSAALFYIAQPNKLRVYVNVPEAYSQAPRPGLTADLTLAEFPGRRFQGKLVRTADAIDPALRTLQVEIELDNPTGQLLSGAYAEVHLKLPSESFSYILPVNTLMFRSEGLRVATVNGSGQVTLTPITIGRDFGNEVEVVSGLAGSESVIVDPPDSVVAGQTVRIARSPGGTQ